MVTSVSSNTMDRTRIDLDYQEYRKRPSVAACIPALNEERTIARVIVHALKYVDLVLVCDDGSKDDTGEIAKALGAVVVRHERNLGYGAAICSLLRKANEMGVDTVVTLDGDGQHDPRQIPRLLESFSKDEADLVIGSRFLNDEDSSKVPRYRKMGLKVITGLASNASYKGLTDTQSGFRAYGRRALQMLSVAEDGMGASTEILLKASDKGLRILEVPITINYEKGTSTHNPVSHGIDVLLSTVKHLSIRHPLMFYGLPGLCLLLVSMFFGVWTLGMFRDTRVIETNIALISFAAGMFGLTLMTTAVILWVTTSVVREKNEH